MIDKNPYKEFKKNPLRESTNMIKYNSKSIIELKRNFLFKEHTSVTQKSNQKSYNLKINYTSII